MKGSGVSTMRWHDFAASIKSCTFRVHASVNGLSWAMRGANLCKASIKLWHASMTRDPDDTLPKSTISRGVNKSTSRGRDGSRIHVCRVKGTCFKVEDGTKPHRRSRRSCRSTANSTMACRLTRSRSSCSDSASCSSSSSSPRPYRWRNLPVGSSWKLMKA